MSLDLVFMSCWNSTSSWAVCWIWERMSADWRRLKPKSLKSWVVNIGRVCPVIASLAIRSPKPSTLKLFSQSSTSSAVQLFINLQFQLVFSFFWVGQWKHFWRLFKGGQWIAGHGCWREKDYWDVGRWLGWRLIFLDRRETPSLSGKLGNTTFCQSLEKLPLLRNLLRRGVLGVEVWTKELGVDEWGSFLAMECLRLIRYSLLSFQLQHRILYPWWVWLTLRISFFFTWCVTWRTAILWFAQSYHLLFPHFFFFLAYYYFFVARSNFPLPLKKKENKKFL